MIITAISTLVFMLMLGFAVDLGAWYLSASKLQRASDAASLAGAGALPDGAAAETAAREALERNGFRDGVNGVSVTLNATSDSFSVSVRDSRVPTHFLKLLFPSVSIGRASRAQSPSAAPVMGTPFNVLGTGDLDIPGLPSRQNFWLAVNGVCSPKEDGDRRSALFDRNKGPFNTNAYVPGTRNFQGLPGSHHHCPRPNEWNGSPPRNPEYDRTGYTYYVDIPKPPSASDRVDIKIYDPTSYQTPGDFNDYWPDYWYNMVDDWFVWGDTVFNLYDTRGTLDDPSDDVHLLPPFNGNGYALTRDDHRVPRRGWWDFASISASQMPEGGTVRIQVHSGERYGQDWEPSWEGMWHIVNSFSIGAFPSWKAPMTACNSSVDPLCPRVYARNEISVFNNLGGPNGSAIDFHFAQVDPSFVGQVFDINLWDPGEGVTKLQLIAPDGTPLAFTYTSDSGGPSSINPVTEVNTNVIESPSRPGMSNPYVFNGRMLTLRVRIPPEYVNMVTDTDDWLKLRYTVNSSPNDRTSWSISTAGSGSGGPAHLTKPVG